MQLKVGMTIAEDKKKDRGRSFLINRLLDVEEDGRID